MKYFTLAAAALCLSMPAHANSSSNALLLLPSLKPSDFNIVDVNKLRATQRGPFEDAPVQQAERKKTRQIDGAIIKPLPKE